MNISEKILKIRKDNNLSQETFAEMINVSRQTVSNWESNKCYPDIESLIIISNKFDISLDDLLKNDIKMIKNIDRKIKINKILKVIIVVILLICTFMFIMIHYKHENDIKNLKNSFTNVEEDNLLISVKEDRITNIDDLEKNDLYVDIYLDDIDLDYSEEKPIAIHSKISKKQEYIIFSVTEEEYIDLAKFINEGYNFKLKINNF